MKKIALATLMALMAAPMLTEANVIVNAFKIGGGSDCAKVCGKRFDILYPLAGAELKPIETR